MTEQAIIINVDDNEPARYAKKRILSRAGFMVHDAANGGEALSLLTQHNPDLVLLDVNLPDLNGIEVCRRIKSSPEGASVIVLQISASSITAPHATAALDNGADSYLAEPVDPDVLIATVRALLRLRKAERELLLANNRLHTMNQELCRSNEDLQQFAFAASHDLQEPLRTITTFVTLLEKTAAIKLTEDEKEYLNHIVVGSRRMRTLIDDLLRYSQVGTGPSCAKPVDLNLILGWALENLHESISKSGAGIKSDLLPTVTGDPAQLGLVFQNLLGNAIKYARPSVRPEIRLHVEQRAAESIISVSDNGMGIESSYLHLIFAPFKRLHGQEIAGTGLGLSVCRRIIEGHQGKIWAESVPGEGAKFCFRLPVSKVRRDDDAVEDTCPTSVNRQERAS